jgi:hypothetical protein
MYPSGDKFYIANPVFKLPDIAHSLGMICRYNGAVRHFYSVAEHSIIVSLLMQELKLGDPMEGLLHDAQEAYVSDMVSPWKQLLSGWNSFEDMVEAPLRKHFGLPSEKTFGCRQADTIALFIEGWFLKQDRGESLLSFYDEDTTKLRAIAQKLIDKEGWRVMNLTPSEATQAFLRRHRELTNG